MSDQDTICPCQKQASPEPCQNQAGLHRVDYRLGDFDSFRQALLRPLPGEEALAAWRPAPQGDLVVQILEWWAYLADVLSLYEERSLNENLLAAAELDESVSRLVEILGYRPRPGIAASAKVGFLMSGKKSVAVPAGLGIDSKPAAGKEAQTFETSAALALRWPDAVAVEPTGNMAGIDGCLYLNGEVSGLDPGEMLVLEPMPGQSGSRALLRLASATPGKDSAGKPYTRLALQGGYSLPSAEAGQYRLLRSRRSAGLWKYPLTSHTAVVEMLTLDSLLRQASPGEPMVLWADANSGLAPALLAITSVDEAIWYANGDGPSAPSDPQKAIALPVTRLDYEPGLLSNADQWENARSKARLLLDWQPAGRLRNAPVDVYAGLPLELRAQNQESFAIGQGQEVFIQDADGNGVLAVVSVLQSSPQRMQILSCGAEPVSLKTPLKVIHNLAAATRGKTVAREILGSGNGALAGQEFVLKKTPLTYLPSGDSYKSTLRVYVDGVLWEEKPSFFEQRPDAQIYVTREDQAQKTHVMFGDGVNGSRLPTGRDNVVATYRFGSGEDAPGAGTLTVLNKPVPGLRAVCNPVAAGGGADPEPADEIRRYAPRSVLTFGRAISADDYQVVAAQAPGVKRVRAVYDWNAMEQRATVNLYVGDTPQAVQSARDALTISADPNRPVNVMPATPVDMALFGLVRVKPKYAPKEVSLAVRHALADPDEGLMGVNRTEVGQGFFFSQLSAACLRVEGVESFVGALIFFSRPDPVTGLYFAWPPRLAVNDDEFFRLHAGLTFIFTEVLSSV
ncbi:hypothetical protein AAU61_13215 [Desulfocarbo indianensis]|nr:hypothetical protein AAU61_13215 [Desulfocarbo indianensis]